MTKRRRSRSLGSILRLALAAALVLPALAVPVPAAAAGATYYVSTSGSDSGSGSSAAPFRTIGKAASVAGAGDSVVVRGGTYDERVTLSGAGSASAPISIAAAAGETVNVARGLDIRGSYYSVRGIDVVPSSATGAATSSAALAFTGSNNTVADIRHTNSAGKLSSSVAVQFSGDSNTVSDIDFSSCGKLDFRPGADRNTVRRGVMHDTTQQFAVFSQSNYGTLEGIEFYNSWTSGAGDCDGINLDGNYITLRGNTFYRVYQRNSSAHSDTLQWWDNANNLTIEGNQFGSFFNPGLYPESGLSSLNGFGYRGDNGHIVFANGASSSGTHSSTGQAVSANNVTIRNNVFIAAGEYFFIMPGSWNGSTPAAIAGRSDNWTITNNTFFGKHGFLWKGSTAFRNWKIANNYFGSLAGAGNALTMGSGLVMDYNAYAGSKSNLDGPNTLTNVSAGFLNANTSSSTNYGVTADYRIGSGSPLRDRGSASYAPSTDKSGASRSGTPDIGAFEYGATAPAPTPEPDPAPEPEPTPEPLKPVARLSGADRYGTAVANARATFPSWTGVTDVVIASGEDRAYPDALSSAGLAGAYRGPLLLVRSRAVPSEVVSAIASMPRGVRLHIVGGTPAVSEAARASLAGIATVASVDRISGADRYGTARQVARRMKAVLGSGMPSTVLLANGSHAANAFDALALSPVAYRMRYPILLVSRDSVPAETSRALAELAPRERLLAGGPPAVSESVRAALGVAAGDRLAGRNRYATAVAIAKRARAEGWLQSRTFAVASALPDALAGGPMIGSKSGVMLFTRPDVLAAETEAFVATYSSGLTGGWVCGADAVVSESVRYALSSCVND